MIPTKMMHCDPSSQDLPLELQRAGTVHRTDDLYSGLMLTGIVGDKERDEVIPPSLRRQNLVVASYPFRTSGIPRRISH